MYGVIENYAHESTESHVEAQKCDSVLHFILDCLPVDSEGQG